MERKYETNPVIFRPGYSSEEPNVKSSMGTTTVEPGTF